MTICSDCKGTKVYKGLFIEEPCKRCGGTGEEPLAIDFSQMPSVQQNEDFEINIGDII